eukprot:SAG22_NODE_329_length_12249_cov_27.341646_2_plen_64_part_00
MRPTHGKTRAALLVHPACRLPPVQSLIDVWASRARETLYTVFLCGLSYEYVRVDDIVQTIISG